jgi:cytochrome c553
MKHLPVIALFCVPAAALADAGTEFFESKVRPLLVERCLDCHGEKKQKGALRLDSRAAWQTGGDSGAALVPGKPEESLLMTAVRYTDKDMQMPPKKKLSEAEIAVLEEWIKVGAPDPREGSAGPVAASGKMKGMSLEEAKHHWAFQPIRNPAPPTVVDAAWPRQAMDRFILGKLEAEQMRPNPTADRRTLIRRATFDLIGLPPTYEEVTAFEQDHSPDAFARVVDSLLNRKEYGQRWGRHWLDVARYADTHEDNVTNGNQHHYPFAYTYRDYVIRAFNEDMPFDRFIIEQLAADKMKIEDRRDLAALGFQTVGRQFKGVDNLIMDDRIDTVTRGFLGLTVACSRCHDHKFDALPTADYYSLYGVFASTVEPLDLPEIGRSGDAKAIAEHLAKREQVLREYAAYVETVRKNFDDHMRQMPVENLQYLVKMLPNHRTVEGYIPLDTPRGTLRREGPKRWEQLIAERTRKFDPLFAPWPVFAAMKREGFAGSAATFIGTLDEFERQPGRGPLHPWIVTGLRERKPQTMLEVAEVYGRVIERALASKEPDELAIVEEVYGPQSPVPATRGEIEEDLRLSLVNRLLVERAESVKAGQLRQKLAGLERTSPVQRAMVVMDSTTPFEPKVFIRGNPEQPGKAVPRQFLTVLGHAVEDRAGPYRGTGRLELAEAIASRDNPLTARVIVNRVWQQHFGQGLVATADNFGVMGDKPSHPELLDHLATWFMEHGWSLKALHRHLLLSATWQQSSGDQPGCRQSDPGNRLLWKMNRRRLEFEPFRDSLLAVAGRLDTRLEGRSQPMDDKFTRRAVYGLIDRYTFSTLLQSFDVAAPESSVSRRVETTAPQQALFMMNSAFAEAQAKALLDRAADVHDAERRIERLHELTFARKPDPSERHLALEFVGSGGESRWIDYAQALLMSHEFTLID